MITIRNPNKCQSLTVVAMSALVNGQLVKLVQAASTGDPAGVASPLVADYEDATVVKGIVYYVPDNDQAVDFTVDPNDSSLTVNAGSDNTRTIPSGSLCTFWFDKPIIGYHSSAFTVTAGTAISTSTREGAKVAFNRNDHLLDTYDAADTDESDVFHGVVWSNDGAELTVLFTAL